MFAPLRTDTVQALLDEARYLDTKPPEEHDMATWRCGSTSCAVGDMCLRGVLGLRMGYTASRVPRFGKLTHFDAVVAALGISWREARWLFDSRYRHRERYGEEPDETAARIRKYVYYRLRKAEILADYESARRTEGDWHVCREASRHLAANVVAI